MESHREERYWSRFAQSYDQDGEYVVGHSILSAFEEAWGPDFGVVTVGQEIRLSGNGHKESA